MFHNLVKFLRINATMFFHRVDKSLSSLIKIAIGIFTSERVQDVTFPFTLTSDFLESFEPFCMIGIAYEIKDVMNY